MRCSERYLNPRCAVGLSVQSVRLEGGDVTRAFMRDAGEYARGSIGSAELLSRTRRRYGLE